MTHCSKVILAAIVVTCGALWIGQAAQAADPAEVPSTQPVIDAHWRDVMTRLGSPTYSEREAAQKELEAINYKQVDMLRQMAAGATDAEVKSRLMTRITQIEEEVAYSPPPITVDVQNGTIIDVATALGKAMDMHLESWPPPGTGQAGVGWTISVKDKPFWEVMTELQTQHGIAFQDINGQLRLTQQSAGLRSGQAFGGLCVFPQSITRSRTVNLQQVAGNQMQPEQMSLSLMAVLDPRVAVSNSMNLEFNKVVDDLGNVLLDQPPAANTISWNNFGRTSHMWNQSVSLTIPQNSGKNIASAQGRLRLLVQLASEKVEVMDMDKKLNTPVTVGTKTVTFSAFKPQPDNNSVQFQMQASGPNRAIQPGAEPDAANAPVTVSFIDSNGKYIWGQTFQGGSGGSFGGPFVPPIKVVISAPTKVKEVTIPFELKDLPLP